MTEYEQLAEQTFPLTSPTITAAGYRIYTNVSCTLISIRRKSGCTGTTAYLKTDVGNATIDSVAFSGNTATFASPIALTAGTYYRVEVSSEGATYTYKGNTTTRTYPYNNDYTNFTIGSTNGGNNSGAYNIDLITVEALDVAEPTSDVAAGTYNNNQVVTLSCATSGASIYYTTNGDAPTTASTLYTGPITVSATSTLKVIGAKANYDDSTVLELAFVFECLDVTSDVTSGTFTRGQLVTLSCLTTTASIYYTLDGTTPSSAKTLYTAPFVLGTTATLKAIAIQSGYTNSAVLSEAIVITTYDVESNESYSDIVKDDLTRYRFTYTIKLIR